MHDLGILQILDPADILWQKIVIERNNYISKQEQQKKSYKMRFLKEKTQNTAQFNKKTHIMEVYGEYI